MTRNKAQKQAVRDRMAKTGERYTTARRYHLDLHRQDAQPDNQPAIALAEPEPIAPEPAVLPPRAADPGISDEAIQRSTGKTWDEWLRLLDAWGAAARTHPEIARHVAAEHGVDGWWAQSVTVGYERARGMRAVHERPDGFSVNVSKTVPVPIERLYAAFVEDAHRDEWLEPGTLRLRTTQPNRSARFDVLSNGTLLSANFTAKGPSKSAAQIQQTKLPTAGDVDVWRGHWKARLDRLAALLTDAS